LCSGPKLSHPRRHGYSSNLTHREPIQGALNWLIEILSPGQSTTKLIEKIQACLDAGTQLGWLFIHPKGKASPSLESCVILTPVADAVLLFHGFSFGFVFGDSNLPCLNPSATPSYATAPLYRTFSTFVVTAQRKLS
jgi:hypothetical protein